MKAIWFGSVKLCSGQDNSTASEPDRFVRLERIKEWQGSWLGACVKVSKVRIYVSSHIVIWYRMRLLVRLSICVGREEDGGKVEVRPAPPTFPASPFPSPLRFLPRTRNNVAGIGGGR